MKNSLQEFCGFIFEGDFWKLNPLNFFMTNPCKKCVVQPCCTCECQKRRDYLLFCWPYKTTIYNKFVLIVIYGGFITILSTVLYAIIAG